jgi:hypothetical protein
MKITEQIIELGKELATKNPTSLALKNARSWWKSGAVSRYSNEDTDVLQSLVSALNPYR